MTLPDSPVLRFLIGAAALVVIIAGLHAGAVFFLPLLLALFLTILSLPLLTWLRAHRFPASLAIAVTLLAVAAVLGVIGIVLTASVEAVTEELPAYQERAREALAGLVAWFDARGIDAGRWVSLDAIQLSHVVDFVGAAFRGVATLAWNVLLVLLMMVFMLWEAMILPEKLRAAHKESAVDLARMHQLVGRLQHYLILKTLISLMVGVTSGLLAWAVGVDFALFWGFLAFLLHYIPNIGAFLAGVPACLLALLQLGPARALVLALGFLVINTVFGNLLEPAVMGRGLRLSPLVVFLALVIWGSIWGALGMILSVPLTVALRIVFESIESTRWLAALLGRRPRVVA